jgi:tape measure domain-containing protein
MSGSIARTVGIRVSTEGADRARRELEQFGTAGEAALRRVEVASLAASPGLQRLAGASDIATRAFQGMGGSLGTVGSTFAGVSVAAGGLTAGIVAMGVAAVAAGVQIAKAGDTATAVLARLASATGSASAAERAFEGLFRLSQQTGIAVADSAGAFARFAVAAKEVGATNDQVLKLVGGLQKAGIVAGASAEETGAATQQLAQALASGVLQGDELRSLLENMPQLAQALARQLGVGIGQLRQMGSEGKLTADRVLPALIAAGEKLAAEFDKLPPTMGRAFGVLGAAMDNFAGQLDKALGLSQAIAKAAMEAAAAVNAVQRYVAPTDRQAAENDVARTRARLEALRASPAMDDGSDPARGYSAIQRAQLQAAATARQSALRQAESDYRTANDRLAEIEREAGQQRFGDFVTAQAKAAEAARTRAAQDVREVVEANDKKLKATREYQEQLAKITRAEAAGVTTLPGGTAFDATRARADALREYQDKLAKANEEGQKATKLADEQAAKIGKVSEALAIELDRQTRLAEAQRQGTSAIQALNTELEIERQLREAGIPPIEKRTVAQQREAEAIEKTVRQIEAQRAAVKSAQDDQKKLDDARREQEQQVKSTTDDVVRYAGDRFADLFSRTGRGWAGLMVDLYRLAVSTFARIAAEAVIRPIVTPIVQGIFGGGSIAGTGGAASGGSSLMSLLGLGNLGETLGLTGPGGLLSSIGSGLGLTGTGGLLGATAITGWGTSTSAALGAMGGAYGPASLAQLQAFGGGGLFGGTGATFGSLLGGAGAGFGAGMLLNGLLGGNQTGGMVGSGLGAAAGAALGSIIPGIGTLLGGILGGAAGGGLGGLFGPGESVRGFGLRLQSAGWGPDAAPSNAMADQLLPIDYRYYNDSGKAVFAQAEQVVAATNAYLAQRGLQVGGVSIIGGNKNGPDYAWADAGSVEEAYTRLRFASRDNADLTRSLQGKTFSGVDKLAQWVDGFLAAQAEIDKLGTAPLAAFTQQIDAINAAFDKATETARTYGLAEDKLATERARQIAALEAQRTETLRQGEVALAVRRLTAEGNTEAAELARQTEVARQETRALTEQLEALAISAAEKSRLLVELEETQAAERAAIIERYADQARDALLRTGGSIRAYLDGLRAGASGGASPSDRLVEAQNAFGRDLTLARGGDADALARITQTADKLLTASRAMDASGTDFQALRQFVISSLENLPATQSYDAQILAALQRLGGSVNVQVGVEVVRVITEALNALPDADRARLIQSATVLRTVEERLGRLLSDVEVDALVQGAVVRRDVEQSMQRDLSVAERAGLVQTADIIRSIQQAMARDLSPAERAGLLWDADITRAIQQAMGRDLSAAERAGLVQAADVLRSVQQAMARDLSPAERAGLLSDTTISRSIEQAMGRDLSVVERAGLVQASDVLRSIEQSIGRNLSLAERESLVASADVARTVMQAIGRDLTATERQGLVGAATLIRSIEQAIGRNLSEAERDSLVAGAAVERSIVQVIGRDLTAAERAGLVQAASVIRTVEQHLGRQLTAAERALVYESTTVVRGISQTILPPTGTIVVPESEAVMRGIWQQIMAATGATLLTDESITRVIRQAIETTETVQISRSIDDKLSGLLTTANAILSTMRDDIAATRGFTREVVQNTQTLIDGRPGDGGEGGGFALGGVFAGGAVVPFARGGIPDLVGRPTLAPMALFGEAGPEAIMPLARRADGSLGVRATMPAASDSLRADLQALRQEVAALRQVLREAALLIATEVRAGTGGTTEAVRKLRATVRDAA